MKKLSILLLLSTAPFSAMAQDAITAPSEETELVVEQAGFDATETEEANAPEQTAAPAPFASVNQSETIQELQAEMQQHQNEYNDLAKRAGMEKEVAFVQENSQKFLESFQQWMMNGGMQELVKDPKNVQLAQEAAQLTRKLMSSDDVSKEDRQKLEKKMREFNQIQADLMATSDPEGAKLMKEITAASEKIQAAVEAKFANENEELQTRMMEAGRKIATANMQGQQKAMQQMLEQKRAQKQEQEQKTVTA